MKISVNMHLSQIIKDKLRNVAIKRYRYTKWKKKIKSSSVKIYLM